MSHILVMCTAWSSSLHSSACLVSSKFEIASGILGRGANEVAYPLHLYALVVLYHWLRPQTLHCQFAMVWAVVDR